MLLDLLVSSPAQVDVGFSSAPYIGTGGVWTLNSRVPATPAAAAIVLDLGFGGRAAIDTVRGASRLVNLSIDGEVTYPVFSFLGHNRTFQGSNYNQTTVQYLLWSFQQQAGFFDIVPFVSESIKVPIAHGLGETPIFALILRRTSTSGDAAYLWIVGESTVLHSNGQGFSAPFSAVNASTFTPTTLFPVGQSFVVYWFGAGTGHAAVGNYVGSGSPQDVALPFAPTVLWVWGLSDFSGNHTAAWADKRSSPLGPGILPGLLFTGGSMLGTMSGATFSADGGSNFAGETYRYLALR